ncbi:hypothetical protein HERIO_926 [Hepatospora eriocheir]|uniref:Uncharacterized protein n=1 Tax=Hepatospora eriocheir TaxID=1081669 RepID=A0A1X0QBT3_9MICR|nr:hypothetical protein HERIO_926 [Hepatospora eriocheir]
MVNYYKKSYKRIIINIVCGSFFILLVFLQHLHAFHVIDHSIENTIKKEIRSVKELCGASKEEFMKNTVYLGFLSLNLEELISNYKTDNSLFKLSKIRGLRVYEFYRKNLLVYLYCCGKLHENYSSDIKNVCNDIPVDEEMEEKTKNDENCEKEITEGPIFKLIDSAIE